MPLVRSFETTTKRLVVKLFVSREIMGADVSVIAIWRGAIVPSAGRVFLESADDRSARIGHERAISSADNKELGGPRRTFRTSGRMRRMLVHDLAA